MDVLRTVAERPCNLVDLCARTGLPRATAHRLAVGLEVHRMVVRDSDGLWHPGPHIGELAAAVQDPLIEAASHVLPLLRNQTGESIQLYRREGSERVCIASAEPPTGLRDTVPVGSRLPMGAGSGAKILAAWTPTTVRHDLLMGAAYTDRALTEVRKRGWSQSIAEREAGVASIAAPIRDHQGTVVAAISVSGPTDRIGRKPAAHWAADLHRAAAVIEKRLAH